ncbi:MAG: MFS transporter [Candidatus Solibacter sp.]|nr:MFS transporter [Candidatus Solibacter sp.]
MDIASNTNAIRTSGSGSALAGFLVSGFLLALLGAILPAWGYHRDPSDFIAVGNFFLSLAIGIVAAARFARPIMLRRGLSFLLVSACGLSCLALLYLALVSPPLSDWWRVAGLLVLGAGAGLLNLALFHAISPGYQDDAAGTVNKGGILYGLGCLAATLLVAGTFYAYTVPSILTFMALVPGFFAGLYVPKSYAAPPEGTHPTLRQALRDFRSPGAVLFALLLFFQFGNEWSIAGWLPIFLIRRVGLSPPGSLMILALYWLFLITGRLIAVALLPRLRHGRLLMGSVLGAIFGCLVLVFTKNVFGAAVGACFVGAGFASIFPLVAEAIGRRFPYYHPGFFNGIFSFALVGGLVAPATLGYAASKWGVGVVVGIPLIGMFVVMILLILIWLESKVTGR